MAIEATGVENVMGEVAHFWQLRKFQFIEEATDFWMDAVAPKECFGDEDPDLRTALTLNQFFTEWLLFEMPYQESTLVGITALRDEISAESRYVLKQIAETQRFSSFKMQWLNPDTSMVQLRDVYSGKCYIVESAHLADKAGWLEGTVSCRIAYVDGGWCCPGEVFLHDTVEWDEVDQSNYVSTDSYGYYVGLCREVLGINGKYQKSCRLP